MALAPLAGVVLVARPVVAELHLVPSAGLGSLQQTTLHQLI